MINFVIAHYQLLFIKEKKHHTLYVFIARFLFVYMIFSHLFVDTCMDLRTL